MLLLYKFTVSIIFLTANTLVWLAKQGAKKVHYCVPNTLKPSYVTVAFMSGVFGRVRACCVGINSSVIGFVTVRFRFLLFGQRLALCYTARYQSLSSSSSSMPFSVRILSVSSVSPVRITEYALPSSVVIRAYIYSILTPFPSSRLSTFASPPG